MQFIIVPDAQRLCRVIKHHLKHSKPCHQNYWKNMLGQLVALTHNPEESLLSYTDQGADGLLTRNELRSFLTASQ